MKLMTILNVCLSYEREYDILRVTNKVDFYIF